VPFKLITIVELSEFAHTWPRNPSPSHPKSVEFVNPLLMFSQPLVFGSSTYAAAAISAKLTTVALSVIFGAGISSIVHAEGDNVQTSPCSLAAANIGSITDGRRSTNRCICIDWLRTISGGISCLSPFSKIE
jgi:hypothetical protein